MTTRNDVQVKVIRLLSVISNMPEAKIDEKYSLGDGLLLALAMRKALASPYTKISKEFGGGTVTMSKAADCETVKDVIDLIWSKIPH